MGCKATLGMFTNSLMKRATTLLYLIMLIASQSWGSGYVNGTFKTTNGNRYLVRANLEKLLLNATSMEVHKQLSMLENYDYMIVTAIKSETILNVESIDFVGLQRILGRWLGKTYIWQFEDYSTLTLTPRKAFGILEELKFSYSIVPNEDKTWTLFMSNPKIAKTATLKINKSIFTLDFLDLPTDVINGDSILTRINEYK